MVRRQLLLLTRTFRGPWRRKRPGPICRAEVSEGWVCVMAKYGSIMSFSRERQKPMKIREGRWSAGDFQAKWWQLMLLFISWRRIFLLLQLAQCEHTHAVWWVPYPSKWTHLHMHCTVPVSPCLCLSLPVVSMYQIHVTYYHYVVQYTM